MTGKGQQDSKELQEQRDLQMFGLLRVQVVPVAALGGQRGGGLQLGWACRRRAAQEAALGGIGDRNRGPTALLV